MNIISRITYFLDDFAPYLILSAVTLIAFILAVFKIYQSKIESKQKKLLIVTSTLILSLVFIFVVAEAYFRYIYDVPDGLGFLKVSKKWTERHVVHNNYFYRDRDFETEKKAGTTRIGILGDSIAYGGGIENPQDRFSNILEKRLKDANYNVEVYNLGRPGYDTEVEVNEFEKVRHLNFDYIIWQYFLNDIQPSIKSTGTRIIETNRDLPGYITFFTNKSYFLDFVYWKVTPTHRKTFTQLRSADIAQYSNQEAVKKHKDDIYNFIQSFKGSNTKIVTIIFPSLLLIGPDYPASHIHQMMSDYFRQNGVDTTDLFEDFRSLDKETLMASNFDPHPNELAHAIVAEKLFNEISPILATSSPSVR